jgi:hypothetical protein
MVWQGMPWFGEAGTAWQAGPGSARLGVAGSGKAGRGMARHGPAWQGKHKAGK